VDRRFERLAGVDVWDAIKAGFNSSFTEKNIASGFKNAGLWPFDLLTLRP